MRSDGRRATEISTEIRKERKMNKTVQMIVDAYISVMSAEKWSSLTDQEKHDVVMTITKDALKALKKLN